MLELYVFSRVVVQTEQKKVVVHAPAVEKKEFYSRVSKKIHVRGEHLLFRYAVHHEEREHHQEIGKVEVQDEGERLGGIHCS